MTILRRRHARRGSTFGGAGLPDTVLVLELAIGLAMVPGFAVGPLGCIYYGAGEPSAPGAFSAAHMSPGVQSFFAGNFYAVSTAATLVVAVYYQRVFRRAAGPGAPEEFGASHSAGFNVALGSVVLLLVAVAVTMHTLDALIFTGAIKSSDAGAVLAVVFSNITQVINVVAGVAIFRQARRISRSLHSLRQSLVPPTDPSTRTPDQAAAAETPDEPSVAVSAASHRRARYLMANVCVLSVAVLLMFVICNQVTIFSIYDRLTMQIVQIAADQAFFWHNWFQVVVWEWPYSWKQSEGGLLPHHVWPPQLAFRAQGAHDRQLAAPSTVGLADPAAPSQGACASGV